MTQDAAPSVWLRALHGAGLHGVSPDGIRLHDAALAEAYEQSAPEHRACIKHCLALQHALWGEDCEDATHTRADAARGFCMARRSRPAPWALFVVSPDYAAPTRLAAALMPALLARVPQVALLCVGGMPSVPVRLALELTGVQDIFCLGGTPGTERAGGTAGAGKSASALARDPLEMAACWLRGLAGLEANASPTPWPLHDGCVALLHHGELDPLAQAARALSLPLWEENTAPRVLNATRGPLVAFCHPDACSDDTAHSNGPCDAVFGVPDAESPHTLAAPLRVAESMEGFWLHNTLSPDFFRRHSTRMTPYTGDDA